MAASNGKASRKPAAKKAAKKTAPKEGFTPRSESDLVTEITLHIRGFGHPEKIHQEHLTSVGRAMHRSFGAENFYMVSGGKQYTFDPLAADGEHIGHSVVLKEQ